jgi:hypothetical protein
MRENLSEGWEMDSVPMAKMRRTLCSRMREKREV